METNVNNNSIISKSISTEDRIKGSFYGLAWGDVFGCPVEGWGEGKIQEIWGPYTSLPKDYPIDKLNHLNPKLIKHLRPIGLYSDDTQQSMALIHCLLSNKLSWNPQSWCQYLSEGVRSSAFRGFGRNFVTSVRNINKGVDYKKCGSPSSGVGAAMRIGPIGALLRNNEEKLIKVATESSLITHGTLLAASLAYAVSYIVYSFVNGRTVDYIRSELPSAVSNMEKHWLLNENSWEIGREDYHFVSSSLRTIFTNEELTIPSKLVEFISKNAKPFLAEGFVKAHPNQGFVGLGGLHGICMSLLPDTYEPQDILNRIVQLGYDTDTVAAIAGTILGARYGYSWIPLKSLMDLERLESYANCLVNQNSQGLESFKEYITKEIYWTDFEKKYKRDLAGKIGKPRSQRDKKYKNHRKNNNRNYRENNKNENKNEKKNEEFSKEKVEEEDNDFDVIDNESNDEDDEKIINQFEMLETDDQ